MASLYKFPGLLYFSGYKYIESIYGDSIISIGQYKMMLQEVYNRYPDLKELMARSIIDIPKSKDNIPKQALLIKLRPGTTLKERSIFKNNLLNFASDNSMAIFDTVTFMDDIQARMGMLDFFNLAIALVCFILGFFQLIVSISANIRDSMWELGVLRAIGMTNHEIMKITIYESFANNLSSIVLGFVIGFIISISMFQQFLLFLELPFSFIVSIFDC